MEQHLALGGNDDPAEVLYTFLFRYGAVKHSNSKISRSYRTALSSDMIVQTEDGGSADLKCSFQIDNCITIFESCWRMLQKRLPSNGKFNPKFSILQYMIDAFKLEQGRSRCKKQADFKLRKMLGSVPQKKAYYSTALPREEKKDTVGDLEARELIKGYGQNVESFLPVEETVQKKNKNKSNKKRRLSKSSS